MRGTSQVRAIIVGRMRSTPDKTPLRNEIRIAVLPTFSRNVRRLRESTGISQEALADMIGINRTRMSRIERNDANVNMVTLIALARALQVKPSVLLEGIA